MRKGDTLVKNSLGFVATLIRSLANPGAFRLNNRRALFIAGIFVLSAAPSLMATGAIKGKVLDKDTKDGLPGATVIVKGTSIGTAADLDGAYSIPNAPSGEQTLVVSYIGYVSTTIVVTIPDNGTLVQDIGLQASVVQGKEVIVTAQAQGQMQAINQQLSSNKIASIVSEARIQELPDFNAAQAIGRLPGVSTLQSSGEANKVVIRGLAPQFNQVAVGGISMASTGSTQIGATSQGGGSGQVNTDRSVDLTMITPYMIKSIQVYKSLTPDMNANAIGGYVNMDLREAPEGLKSDILAQSGYTQKSGKYGNYRFVAAGSDRFFDDNLGIYVLGNDEQYDRNADNMNATYTPQSSIVQPNGFRPVIVTGVTLDRHVETRQRYGGNLIMDYRLPEGTIKFVNVFSRISANTSDYRTGMDYQFHNLNFTYRAGHTNTDAAVNSLQYTNDFGFMSADIKVGNTYSRNHDPGSPEFDFSQTGGIPGTAPVNAVPESLSTLVSYKGPSKVYLTNISYFSADYKENDQVYKGDFKMPYSLEDITSGYFKFGGEFRYNYHTNNQGTPYAGIRPGSPISNQLVNLIQNTYHLTFDSSAGYFPGTNFTSSDSKLFDSFLGNKFGNVLWASGTNVLDGVVTLLQNTPAINAINSSGTNAGGWTDGPFQRLPNKYKYIEKYTAGYLMTELNVGSDVTVTGGARWEQVQGLFDAYNLSDGRDARTQVVDSVFSHPSNVFWLPMVQAKWNVVDWADLRYSFTKTLARPDYGQLSPHFSMDYTQFNVFAGNPDLKTAQAQNHDVFLTFHNNELGLFSIGGFYKKVVDFTYYTQYTLHNASQPGLDSTGSFTVSTASGLIHPKDGAQLYTYVNASSPAYIRGIEFDLQTRLWYLPQPFDGIVLGINYTVISSNASYPWRNDTTIILPPDATHPRGQTQVVTLNRTRAGRLINQPNNTLNASIGYDYKGFSGRLSFLFQGNSVSSIGAFAEQDGFTKDYFSMDFSAHQMLPWPGLQLFLEITNLNSRINQAAQASINGFTLQQNYGLVANLGIRYTM